VDPGDLGWIASVALVLVLLISSLNLIAIAVRALVLGRQEVANPF
jgi:hypothetical protein